MTAQSVPTNCHMPETLRSKEKLDIVQERSNLWGHFSPWVQRLCVIILCSEVEVSSVDLDSYLKFADIHMESHFFSTFVILDFCGPTLGHVSRHVGTCHVGVLHIKWKVLKNWCVWPPRFWKSDQNWGSYGLDNENIQKTSLRTSSQLWLTPWLGCDMVTSGIFSLSRP